MKKYSIVSTYPEHGTKNIGDSLIASSTIEAIKTLKGEDISVNKIWRADSWKNIKDKIIESDAVVFACLAIRKHMDKVEYPYLNEIVTSGIPFGVISSGTHLPVTDEKIFDNISNSSLKLLKAISERALFFTTRGLLSQSFCDYHKLKSEFSGDIAFYDKRYISRRFESGNIVKKIAVSDPHYPYLFLPSFKKLVKELKKYFPSSEITVMLHGVNSVIEQYCLSSNTPFLKIFENPIDGLDLYDEFDMHVGYRIHAHVSALKRRKYSYLLEQDGRGNDYGLTMEKKISINSFSPDGGDIINKIKNKINHELFGQHVNTTAVDFLMSIISQDRKCNFEKFIGLENQIKSFNEKCLTALANLP